jgi:hypothetical protein
MRAKRLKESTASLLPDSQESDWRLAKGDGPEMRKNCGEARAATEGLQEQKNVCHGRKTPGERGGRKGSPEGRRLITFPLVCGVLVSAGGGGSASRAWPSP